MTAVCVVDRMMSVQVGVSVSWQLSVVGGTVSWQVCGGQYDVSMGGYTSVVTAVCEVGKLTAVCGSGDEEGVSVAMWLCDSYRCVVRLWHLWTCLEYDGCMWVGTLLKHAVSLLLFMPISLPYIILCFSWYQNYVKAKEYILQLHTCGSLGVQLIYTASRN